MPISQINTNSIASSPGLTTPTIAQINSAASLTPTLFYDNAGVQVGTLCRAWVNFNGADGSKRASFNVSSVTRTGTGSYTVNFTNAFADANYSYAASGTTYTSNYVSSVNLPVTTLPSTSSLQLTALQATGGGNLYDPGTVCVQVFR